MADDEDVWINASSPFLWSAAQDPKPLAALLRSEMPIPVGFRHTLADLLEKGYLGRRLAVVQTETERQEDSFLLKTVPIANAYNRAISTGLSSQEAAANVAEEFGVSDRTVYRCVADRKAFNEWLKGAV